MIRRPWTALWILALAATARTQQTTVEWSGGAWMSADFGAPVVTGHFAGYHEPDVVVIEDGTLAIALSPAVFQQGYLSTFALNDMARVPGTPDTLLTVGPSGLVELTWDGANGEWDETTHESTAWIDARAVRLGDIDGDGNLDAIGLASSANADTIHVLYGTGSGFGSPATITTSADAEAIEIANWDGSGGDEIVAVTDAGIEVWTPAAMADIFSWTASTIRIATFPAPAGNNDRVVATFDSGSTQYLVTWDATGVEAPTVLSSLEVHQLATADWDNDGDHDLFLSLNALNSYARLENRSGTSSSTTFDPANYMTLVPFGNQGRDPSWSVVGVGLADFDLDGDVDILPPVQGNWDGVGMLQVGVDFASELALSRNDTIDHWAMMVTTVRSEAHQVLPAVVELDLTLLAPESPLQGPTGTMTAVKCTVWHMPYLGAPSSTLSEVTLYPPNDLLEFTVCTAEFEVQLGGVSLGDGFDDIYPMMFRTVVYDPVAQETVTHGPAFTAVYGTNTDAALKGNSLSRSWVAADTGVGGGNGHEDGGGTSGGPRVPPISNNP